MLRFGETKITKQYVKTFKVKDGDKGKKFKLICFYIDDENLLGQYEGISTKIEDLEKIELNALPVYDDRFIKIKIRTYSNNSANSVIESHKSFLVQRKFLLHVHVQ